MRLRRAISFTVASLFAGLTFVVPLWVVSWWFAVPFPWDLAVVCLVCGFLFTVTETLRGNPPPDLFEEIDAPMISPEDFNRFKEIAAELVVKNTSGEVIRRLPLKFEGQTGDLYEFDVFYQDVTFGAWSPFEIADVLIEFPDFSSQTSLGLPESPLFVKAGSTITISGIGLSNLCVSK